MLLKIHTVEGIIFDGEVERAEIPTELGVICVLPHHNPLTTMVLPGLLKFLPESKKGSEFLSDTEFLFEDERIALAIGEGMLYTDGEVILLFVSSATVNPKTDHQTLLDMKTELEAQIKSIKEEGSLEEIEKAYLHLQRLTADIKLLRIKDKKKSA